MDPPENVLSIDRLELDLKLSDWNESSKEKIIDKVHHFFMEHEAFLNDGNANRFIDSNIESNTYPDNEFIAINHHREYQIIEHFLKTGQYPWNGMNLSKTDLNEMLHDCIKDSAARTRLFDDVISHSLQSIVRFLQLNSESSYEQALLDYLEKGNSKLSQYSKEQFFQLKNLYSQILGKLFLAMSQV